ncbi:V(D)J recombination-activating protein 1-like [Mercenaria mercenaria]|uniref:V(D)J recombination-activating protein 1-like n=1 Tax=Mercenaria mercenaria TaxID=6596 RepID=UPI00234F74B8|nr:V(D)J recombination-activating protein 1-like [Mercenaria mercenaria]
MIDEKFDRSESGLAGSGSRYLCTLCEATREDAMAKLGSFNITRTYKQTKQIADYMKINPDNLSQAKLDKISLGVKNAPILCADAIEKGIDSTHADINMASFFKKVIIREMAGVTMWEMKSDVKSLLFETENKFDRHIRMKTGINPALMVPGNYARTLFDIKNEEVVCALIEPLEGRHLMCEVLSKFRHLRTMYRAKSPMTEYAEDVKCYKQNAVEMGQFLRNHYP